MSKLHISTLALAAMVAAGAAFPLAARADETKTTTAALKHRWTFNTDLKDSVTGYAAQKIGSSVAVEGGVVKLTGNGAGAGSVNLGQNLLPGGEMTIELWATHTATRKWSRIIDVGPNNTHYITMAWANGTDINNDHVEIDRAGSKYSVAKSLAPFTINTKYHPYLIGLGHRFGRHR